MPTLIKHNRNGIRAARPQNKMLHCFKRAAVLSVIIIYKLCCDFRIGLRIESISVPYKLFSEFGVIFYYTVMNDDSISAVAKMRVGIYFRRLAVCSPTRVSNSAVPIRFTLHERIAL